MPFERYFLSLFFAQFVVKAEGWKETTSENSLPNFRHRTLSESTSDSHLQYVLRDYFTNAQLEEHMRNFTARCGISKMFSIGKSAEGVDLWALEISNHPGKEEPKPAFKYVGNMHGDEPTGRVLQLAFAEWLCAHWNTDARAKQIVEGVKLYLLPTMNPDGFAAKRRENSGSVDLNRDFPDPMHLGSSNLGPTGTEQPETLAIMNWSKSTRFVASASMHEGAYVANYPWDGSLDKRTHYSSSPDDKAFIHLAKAYASLHGKMNTSDIFKDGITNGAAWYPLWGGMQDWNYVAAGCMELTLELSQNKWPPKEQLSTIWEDNKLALANLPLVALFQGIRGKVWDRATLKSKKDSPAEDLAHAPLVATISVEGIDHNVTTNPKFGDYYRPLAPGHYVVTAFAPGYLPASAQVHVPNYGSGALQDFLLDAEDAEVSTVQGKLPSQLPRRFGAFDHAEDGVMVTQVNDENGNLLISESMWINMMQTALLFFLGCSMGLLGLSVLVALRVVTINRSGFPSSFRLLGSSR